MKPVYRITPRALSDLRNIGYYTFERYGKEQQKKYLLELDKRFLWLAKHPQIGKHRPDLCEGYYCYPQGSHIIFYLIHSAGIDIIGIPHQSMDINRYFER